MNTFERHTPESLQALYANLLTGHRLERHEADALATINDPDTLDVFFKLANDLREHFMGNDVELCSIINAKSGKCSEDCKFCAQSAHYNTSVETYDLMDYAPIEAMAKENAEAGVHRFSLVTSGYGATEEELKHCLAHYTALKAEVPIHLCASLGVLNAEQFKALKATGVTMYHHNVETSRRYYKDICTTHSYDVRIQTIKDAQSAGLRVCSGGIIGMGETQADRLDMIFELRALGIDSVPVNVLNPIPGTPLSTSGIECITESEIYKTIALYRWIHPTADIRLAGGRALIANSGRRCFELGASATISGNYLTTSGQNIADDLQMITELGLKSGLGGRSL